MHLGDFCVCGLYATLSSLPSGCARSLETEIEASKQLARLGGFATVRHGATGGAGELKAKTLPEVKGTGACCRSVSNKSWLL